MIPDKIYIRHYWMPGELDDEWLLKPAEDEQCEEYIRKDALLEWANDVKQGLIVEMEKYGVPNKQRVFAFQEFIDKINSL